MSLEFASLGVGGQHITPMMALLTCNGWANAPGGGHGDEPFFGSIISKVICIQHKIMH